MTRVKKLNGAGKVREDEEEGGSSGGDSCTNIER
jgi:hypothetical protein